MLKHLIDYYPDEYKKVFEFQKIAHSVEGQESDWGLVRLRKETQAVFDNQFVETADENGILRFEHLYGIIPSDTDTIAERRDKIRLYMLIGSPSYTIKRLHDIMRILCGSGNYSVDMNAETCELTIRVALASRSVFDEAVKVIKAIIPANITLDMSLMYNKYELYENKTHLQLEPFTHEQLREEEW